MEKDDVLSVDIAWQKWIECLTGKDTNSIFQQISTMIWDTAIFHIILESRNNEILKHPDSPEINWTIHSFIDRNYFQSQCAYIRRITDTSYGLTGAYGIYSVGALIKTINNYRLKLTRVKFLGFRKMPFDYTEIQAKHEQFFRDQSPGKAFIVPSEFDWESIEETHQTFDRLCGKDKENRKTDDIIDECIFTRLINKLAVCNDISTYVDKYVAHAATPESRSYKDTEKIKITLNKIWEANETIFKVANFLAVILLSEDHMPLAFEPPSFYDHWDKPLFPVKNVNEVRLALENFRKETEECMKECVKEVFEFLKDEPSQLHSDSK